MLYRFGEVHVFWYLGVVSGDERKVGKLDVDHGHLRAGFCSGRRGTWGSCGCWGAVVIGGCQETFAHRAGDSCEGVVTACGELGVEVAKDARLGVPLLC